MDPYAQQNHQKDPYNTGYPPHQEMAPVMSVKDWMIITLVMIIPIVNIIMMFVWAFGEGNPNRKNYFKASLIWAGIILDSYVYSILGGYVGFF
jgi:hypothetical protein